MGESFEAKLIAASSKEVFKKAKHIVRNNEVLCCHEAAPGILRAICRDSDGFVSRAELRGFPNGPFSGTCSCKQEFPGFCPHSMAAALYHAKYTIKYKEPQEVREMPAQYMGLNFSALPVLLKDVAGEHPHHIELAAETEFPHVPSKWERVQLVVSLKIGRREYAGNLNNLRQLHFEKSLAASVQLTDFSLQDRQIIRYLAINAQQDGTKLSLDAEQCAELFGCLIDFPYFTRMNEKVVVHGDHAQPCLLLEKLKGGYLLRSALLIKGSPLPLKDVKVITGRNGCWAGMLGEYWWIPGQTEVSWIRNFLRTTEFPCDMKTAKDLFARRDSLPIKIIPSTGIKLKERKFKILYDGNINESGALELSVLFDYGGRLCKPDQFRFGSSQNGSFWRRNTREEFEVVRELLNFGFDAEIKDDDGMPDPTGKLRLADREAVGMFIDELIPKWLREKRDCLLSGSLASLCAQTAQIMMKTTVLSDEPEWFTLKVDLTAGGIPVRWKDVAAASGKNEFFMSLPAVPGTFLRIPKGLRLLSASIQSAAEELPPLPEHPGSDILKIPRTAAHYWAEAASELPGAVPMEFLRIKLDADDVLNGLSSAAPAIPKDLFHGELRQYQKSGVYWLHSMLEKGYNLILADEMGLGKTVQTLALLAIEKKYQPALIVCPTSLVENWYSEAMKFLPEFRTMVISGPDREERWKQSAGAELCITSYALLKRDINIVRNFHFSLLVLDEAQHIKNPASLNAQTCKMIAADHRFVLTGTPLENSAEDLWSIFDFLHPHLFGSIGAFRNKYADLIRNTELKQELSRRIAPFLLRRKKADVCTELPPKQEQLFFCEMGDDQRALYEKVLEQARMQCRQYCTGQKETSRFHILASLMRLRQICCDPALLPEDMRSGVIPSAKMDLLQEILMETMDSGHKVLFFSQFTSLLKIVKELLDKEDIRYEYLDGSTKDRLDHVRNFNEDDSIRVFLLSLKAGGVGLNLTAADTVIIFDPWWNPAAEDQAMDRSHRIGQTRNVNCIRLAVKNSIEERVLELHERKRELFSALVDDSADSLGALSVSDLEFLLNAGPAK